MALDVFAVIDQAVATAWWRPVPTPHWQGWSQVATAPAPLLSSPTALTNGQDPSGQNNLDAFAAGSDGNVYTAWFRPAQGWQGWSKVAGVPGGVKLQPGLATVVSSVDSATGWGNLDAFAAGSDGNVYTAWFRPAQGWQGWSKVASSPGRVRPGVAAVVTNFVPTCSVRVGDLDLTVSGDALYGPRACNQDFMTWAWEAYDFDQADWDNGFGYEEPCQTTRPLARTYNALWCLENSAPGPEDSTFTEPIIFWAGLYAREQIDELDGRCGSWDGPIATTHWGPIIDENTELYMPFFYTRSVPERAGTIIHEARHASWKSHDDDPLDSSWAYNGAWRYHVSWLAEFANKCLNTSPAMKALAVQRANQILDDRFTHRPEFFIDASGVKIPKDG
jgi:hypothetical protein